MSFVAAEILRELLGPQAAGPAGFDVRYNVEGGANVSADGATAEVKLDENSLARARSQSEGGKAPQQHEPKTGGPAPDALYAGMFAKRGLDSVVNRGMSAARVGGRRLDHRAAMARAPEKSPLARAEQRSLLRLRKTFDEISGQKKKTVKFNPENLPQEVLKKIAQAALDKGAKMTALGSTKQAMKAAGYNSKEWSRWEHALEGGFSNPRPRPT